MLDPAPSHSYIPRYAVGIIGANYAPPVIEEAADWILCSSKAHIIQVLNALRHGNAQQLENTRSADGTRVADTPLYGRPGDGAFIYRIPRPKRRHVDRLAASYYDIDFTDPIGYVKFGPRGGLTYTWQ